MRSATANWQSSCFIDLDAAWPSVIVEVRWTRVAGDFIDKARLEHLARQVLPCQIATCTAVALAVAEGMGLESICSWRIPR